jgi:hypothetical protein
MNEKLIELAQKLHRLKTELFQLEMADTYDGLNHRKLEDEIHIVRCEIVSEVERGWEEMRKKSDTLGGAA